MFNHGSVQLRKSPGGVGNVPDLSGFHRDPSPLRCHPRKSPPFSWPGAHLAAVQPRSVCRAFIKVIHRCLQILSG